MKRLFFVFMCIGFACSVFGQEKDMYDGECTCEEGYYKYPYEADCDECWYWEDEARYPTMRENTWMHNLTRPW